MEKHGNGFWQRARDTAIRTNTYVCVVHTRCLTTTGSWRAWAVFLMGSGYVYGDCTENRDARGGRKHDDAADAVFRQSEPATNIVIKRTLARSIHVFVVNVFLSFRSHRFVYKYTICTCRRNSMTNAPRIIFLFFRRVYAPTRV